jgi:hypothetical protein
MRAMLSAAHAVAVVATRKWFVSAHGMRCRDRRCSSICPSILMESNLTTYVSIRGRRARVCSAQKLSNLTVYVSGFFISPVKTASATSSQIYAVRRCVSNQMVLYPSETVSIDSVQWHMFPTALGGRNEMKLGTYAICKEHMHAPLAIVKSLCRPCILLTVSHCQITWIAAAAPLSGIPPSCDAQLCNAAHA